MKKIARNMTLLAPLILEPAAALDDRTPPKQPEVVLLPEVKSFPRLRIEQRTEKPLLVSQGFDVGHNGPQKKAGGIGRFLLTVVDK